MSYLYFIRAKNSPRVKIGYSKHPSKRLQQLQTGSADELYLEKTYEVTDYKYAEQIVHTDLKRFRLHGEWFEITTEDLEEYMVVFEEFRLPGVK